MKNNLTMLQGELAAVPTLSHESYGRKFYRAPLAVRRTSGAVDTLQVILSEELLAACPVESAQSYAVTGEIRTYNQPEGTPRTLVTCYARTLTPGQGLHINEVHIKGKICKQPTYRMTPLGREICDLILAVPREYTRTDYLPCVCWGGAARAAASHSVGEQVALTGRFQSRSYQKSIDGTVHERIAYEISVLDFVSAEAG